MRTLRRTLLASIAIVALASPASAGGGGGKAPAGTSNKIAAGFSLGEPEAEPAARAESPRGVDLPPLVAPSVVDDQLANYLFIQLRIVIVDGVDVWKVREKAPHLLDALIRASHRTPVNRADDSLSLDEEAARAVFLAAIGEVVDPGHVEKIEFLAVDPGL